MSADARTDRSPAAGTLAAAPPPDAEAAPPTSPVRDAVRRAEAVVMPRSPDPSAAFGGWLRSVPRRPRWLLLVARQTVTRFAAHHGLSWSAAIAFYLVLSTGPLLIALSAVAALVVGDEHARTLVVEQIARLLPAESDVLQSFAEDATHSQVPTVASILFLLFAGSRVISSLVEGITVMWRHVETAGFWQRQRSRLVLVPVFIVLVGLSVLVQGVLTRLGDAFELGAAIAPVASQVASTVLVMAGLTLTYLLVPRGSASVRAALAGGITAGLLIRVAQAGFDLFVRSVAQFEAVYASLAGVAVLLFWALIASMLVLVGAELVATLDRHRPARLGLESARHEDGPDPRDAGAPGEEEREERPDPARERTRGPRDAAR